MTRTCRGGEGKLRPRGPPSKREERVAIRIPGLAADYSTQQGAAADNDRPIPILSLLLSLKNMSFSQTETGEKTEGGQKVRNLYRGHFFISRSGKRKVRCPDLRSRKISKHCLFTRYISNRLFRE